MQKNFTPLKLMFVLLFVCPLFVGAQIYWDFSTATATSNPYSNVSPGAVSQGNNNGTTTLLSNTSASSGYSGASAGNNAGLAARTGGFDQSQTAYFEFSLTPTGNNSIVITGISFGSRSTATGPQGITVRTSVDNYSTDQYATLISNNSVWALLSGTFNVIGGAGATVTVRIYGYNGTGTPPAGTANWRIDDLAVNPVTLPLQLVSFKASFNGKSALLNWTTMNEQNVQGFAVEKSANGLQFDEMAFVKAQNAEQNQYAATDANVNDGANFYRLKMVDRDGSSKYSQVLVVKNAKAVTAQLFPNPTKGSLTITHPAALGSAVIKIVSVEGRQIKSYSVQRGAMQTTLGVADLVKGNYLLVFENDGVRSSAPFVKQ